MTTKGKGDRRDERDRPDEPAEGPREETGSTLVDWIKSFAIAFGLFVVLRFFVVATFVITSGSMEASLLEGDLLLADRMAYGARIPGSDLHLPGYAEPTLGDVVVFEPHHDFDGKVVKRIVGVGGDTLAMRDGVLHRNGEPQEEPYVSDGGAPDLHDSQMLWQTEYLIEGANDGGYRPTRDTWGPLVVPEGHYFLIGDHRDASYDSRYWGPLAGWRLEARVAAIYFSYDPDALEPFPWVTAARWGRIGRFASPDEAEDAARSPSGEDRRPDQGEMREPRAAPEHVETVTSDGVTIHGELFADGLAPDAPLVLLFHQGGSSGRGEYAEIARWLNELGYRAIAWDQRAGGDLHGVANRTVEGLAADVPAGYCDAYPDLQGALDHATEEGLTERVVVWGSSYSAALVFRLAAENPDRVSGLLAFSPASGGPMAECRAREWLGNLRVPALVFRPGSEMERASSVEQRDLFTAAGLDVHVIEDGVHGSSMLLDARTGRDMTEARELVAGWLKERASTEGSR